MKRILLLTGLAVIVNYCTAQTLNYDYNKYDWNSSPISFTPDKKDTGHSSMILDQKVFTEYSLIDDKLTRTNTVHTIRYLFDDKAIESNNKIYLAIEESENLLDLKARIINNGKITSETGKKSMKTVKEEGQEYKILAIEGLSKGVIIETLIKYKIATELNDNSYVQFGEPILKKEFTLIYPSHLLFNSKVYNVKDYKRIDSTMENTRTFNCYLFNDLKAYDFQEKYSFDGAFRGRIEYTYSENLNNNKKYMRFPEIGARYFEAMNTKYADNEKAVDKLLTKINIKQYKTDEEKIFAIESYLKSNIAIKDEAPSEESVKNVLDKKYANVGTISNVYFYCFRKAEIPFELVLTCKRSYREFDPEFDSWSFVKFQLFYFPGVKKFLDPEAFYLRLGTINNEFLYQHAVFVKAVSLGDNVMGIGSVKQIPGNTPESGIDDENITVSLTGDMLEADLKLTRKMYSYADLGLRAIYFYAAQDKRDEAIKEQFKAKADMNDFKSLKVSNYNLDSKAEFDSPFIIEADIKTKGYCEKAGNKISFKLGELIGEQVEMYQEKPRQSPVGLTYAHSYNRTITLNIPAGYKVKGLDAININHVLKDKDGNDKAGFVSNYELKDGKLIVHCKEYYNAFYFPLSEFEPFKQIINDAADFNKIVVLLEKE